LERSAVLLNADIGAKIIRAEGRADMETELGKKCGKRRKSKEETPGLPGESEESVAKHHQVRSKA
jgi:hypothetical protein